MRSPEQFTPKPKDSKSTQTVFKRYDGCENGVYEGIQPDPEVRQELEAELEQIFSGKYELKRSDIPAVVGDLIEVIGGGVRIDGDGEIREWSNSVIDDKNKKMYDLYRTNNEDYHDELTSNLLIHDIEWHHFQTRKSTPDDVQKPLYTQLITSQSTHLSINEDVTFPRGFIQALTETEENEKNNVPSVYSFQLRDHGINTTDALSFLKNVYDAYKAGGTIKTQTEVDSTPAEDI